MKIALVEPKFLTPRPYAVAYLVWVQDLARALARLGNQVWVLAEGQGGAAEKDGYKLLTLGGSLRTLGPLSGGRDSLPTLSPFFSPRFLPMASHCLRELKVDAIYTAGTPISALVGAWLGSRTHIPSVHHVFLIPSRAWWRMGLIKGYPTPLSRILLYVLKDALQELVKPDFLARWGLRRVARVLAASQDLRSRLGHFGLGSDRVSVVYPGVDMPVEAPPLPSEPVITYFGHLSQERGALDALEAFARIAPRFPQARFSLAVTDVTPTVERYFHQMVAQHGLSSRVFRQGIVSDVYHQVLFPSSIVVLPYRTTPSIKLIEAMAAGRPVITTRLDWAPEVIADGENGFLVGVGDRDALAQRLAWLLENPGRAQEMGRRAQETVQTRFGLEKSSREVLSVMEGSGHKSKG